MVRPREFNVDVALDEALRLFWRNGYEATSMQDLLAAMGLSRSSFYDCFGSKHEVLISAIRRYCEHETAKLDHLTADGGPVRPVLASILRAAYDSSTGTEPRVGCLMVNCAVELAPRDPMVEAEVRTYVDGIERRIEALLRRGQQTGEVNPSHDPRALAQSIMIALTGLLVMSKAGRDRDTLERASGNALRLLD
ncbi:MAG TPA: TetR/AcrR family transcriptional regulator [Arenibaculum sp.]|nr:TetR/AcrR family transcriptional regulator [Arenibaculum sp.]